MMTRVFLLRHAETANPTVFHGAESDIGLSARGEAQARAVAEALVHSRPSVVVASAMQRARATASAIATACALDVLVEPDLHERRVGILSGRSFQSEDIWPKTVERWMAGETTYASPGAESFAEIRQRVLPVWQRITATFAGKTMVVVAHGIVCKVLLLSILPGHAVRDWQKLGPIHNVALTELELRETGWHAVRINQHADLVRERGLIS